MALSGRDDREVAAGLARWWTARHADAAPATVSRVDRPTAGWSNETLLVTVEQAGATERVVVRMPTVLPSFPVYDLTAQAEVQRALVANGIAAPVPIEVELDEAWLGTPFFVMTFAAGRPIGEVTGLDPWLIDAGQAVQRRVQEGFLSLLADLHRLDWRSEGLDVHLRGATRSLGDETRWWIEYVDWSADGSPGARLSRLATWCEDTAPRVEAPPSLCWGDARLGNVLFDGEGHPVAALDWEMATIGPAEIDLAWYLALERLTAKVAGHGVPGFLDRAGAVAYYEARLGRRTRDLAWHEIFALVRSTAINERQGRLAARAGVPYPGIPGDENPMLGYIERQIERHEVLGVDA